MYIGILGLLATTFLVVHAGGALLSLISDFFGSARGDAAAKKEANDISKRKREDDEWNALSHDEKITRGYERYKILEARKQIDWEKEREKIRSDPYYGR